jgi:hypothetical protein
MSPARATRRLLAAAAAVAGLALCAPAFSGASFTGRATHPGTSFATGFWNTPTGTSWSAVNGGATVGKPETGDQMMFAFSHTMAADSIVAGWSGAATTIVNARFATNGARDTLTITTPGGAATHLASAVALQRNYVLSTVTFAGSTLARSADGRTFTVTLGTPDLPAKVRGAQPAANAVWTFDTTATDTAGIAVQPGSLAETDGDVDF